MTIHAHDDYSIYQTSTIAALIAGVYDGDLTIDQLLEHGDFGLGTFNHLDGEMVVVDGICYHLRADGSAAVAAGTELTPFAAVTPFEERHWFDVTEPTPMAALTARIDAVFDGEDPAFAVRLEGTFTEIRTRTVARQSAPYVPLTEAVQGQSVTTLLDATGTVAGFRIPSWEAAVSVAGFHLHFVDQARERGGHVLDLVMSAGSVSLSHESELHLSMPNTAQFRNAHIDLEHVAEQVRAVEE